jgi:chromosome segregation ATPase
MIEASLLAIVVIATANLFVAIRTLRSSLRSEELGESRYELLRDEQERLELLREERRTLIDALEQESQECRQLLGYLESGRPQLVEDLKNKQERHLVAQQQAERQEQEQTRLRQELQRLQERLERERREQSENQQMAEQLAREHQDELTKAQQEAERSEQERQQLAEVLERESEERVKTRRQAERLEQELARLEQELGRSQAELERRKQAPAREASRASHPWWRRPILVVGLLLGVLIAWFTSLTVALSILGS